MRHDVVVGYDGSPADAYALSRALQLGDDVLVLSTQRGRPPLPGDAEATVRRVPHLSAGTIFESALSDHATHVVLSDYAHGPVTLLRHALAAASHRHAEDDAPLLGVLISRWRRDREATPYSRVLVGADATPGAGFAALAAAHVAQRSSAHLVVASVERRRDYAQRQLFERLTDTEPLDGHAERPTTGLRDAQLEMARLMVEAHGVDAEFEYRLGDPSDVLVRATRFGDYDLLVSGVVGMHSNSAHGQVGRLTRKILRLSPVDHLVVFDALSLGLLPARELERATTAAARLLFGGAAVDAALAGREEVAAPPSGACDIVGVLDDVERTATGLESFVADEKATAIRAEDETGATRGG